MSDRYIRPGDNFPWTIVSGNILPECPSEGRQYIAELRADMSGKRYVLGMSGGWPFNAETLRAWIEGLEGTTAKMFTVEWTNEDGEKCDVEFWATGYNIRVVGHYYGTDPYTTFYEDTLNTKSTFDEFHDQNPKNKTVYFTWLHMHVTEPDYPGDIRMGMISAMMDGHVVPSTFPHPNGFYDTWNGVIADSQGTTAQQLVFAAFNNLSIPDEDLGNEMESSESDFPGDYQYHDEQVDFPDVPEDSALDAGFITLYRTDKTSLQTLGSELWSASFTETILKNFDSPFENIISLNILPVQVTGTATNIKIGNYESAAGGEKIETQFVDLDGGTCEIPKIFGNQLDFEPATTCEIYIPFIGYRKIDLDDASGGTLQLRYRLDLLTGNLLAMIRVIQNDRYPHDSVEYYFVGNCATSVPISGANYMAQYSNMIGGLHSMGMVVGASSPGLVGLAGVGSAMTSKPSYQRSGALSGNVGFMGQLTAFLLISSPKQGYDYRFKQYAGVRSHMFTSFGSLTGFQQVQDYIPDASLVSVTTNEELEEINKLLMEGVIF